MQSVILIKALTNRYFLFIITLYEFQQQRL